jgi:hypothetical protein|tara:strand:- start:16264 stop:16668 length:405 start_codon:yes stop_codon:yes gene_type:complete
MSDSLPSVLVRCKAWLTIVVGLAFLLLPVQVFVLLGADLVGAGQIMTQLFGLLAIAVGYGMLQPGHPLPAGREALVTACSDIVAVFLLINAVGRDVFGALGYLLVAVYLVSALLYLYLCVVAKNRPRPDGAGPD